MRALVSIARNSFALPYRACVILATCELFVCRDSGHPYLAQGSPVISGVLSRHLFLILS